MVDHSPAEILLRLSTTEGGLKVYRAGLNRYHQLFSDEFLTTRGLLFKLQPPDLFSPGQNK
jgi:hypothetical protein